MTFGYRRRTDPAVSATYWAGAVLGTLGTFILLNVMDPSIGWRIGFLIGPVLGVVILLVRRNLPESPRWQVMNGREEAAEQSISYIEHEVEQSGKTLSPVDQAKAIELRPTNQIGYLALIRVLFREYPSRAVLGASLMISQSFLYNSIFFTYPDVRLVCDLLLCLVRGQRRLSDGQRDLPARGASKSDRGVLRHCAMFRRAWSGHLRSAHR